MILGMRLYTNRIKNMCKISVIIPVYNTEEYISQCLESLVNQTFKDIEIICVNDGSQDKSLEVLQDYAEKDDRIIVINQENSGVSVARNNGLKLAKGEFITFVDSDDWVDVDFIERLYDAITLKKCDIAVTTAIRKRKHSSKYRLYYRAEAIYSTLAEKIEVCQIPKCCYVWGKLYKANIIKDMLFTPNVYFEDVLWLPEVIKKSEKLVTVPGPVYYYRVNNKSIVKTTPTPKKQKDSYLAKKYIVDFFNENDLVLSEKEKNVTKCVKYCFNIPILKIKEKKYTNTVYLFSFLPIFKFVDFDSHYIFKLGFTRITKRHKTGFPYEEVNTNGINTSSKRTPRLIVSLTSFPARINFAKIAVNTLLRQSLKPDKLILWLAESEFPNKEYDLPKDLLKLKNFGLEIKWCTNLLSYKKLIPALKEYPEDIIVTADDDLYYDKNWLKSLYESYLKQPEFIHVQRAVHMQVVNNCIKSYPREKQFLENYKEASFSNQLMGGSGCLFPPHCLHEDVFNTDKFLKLIPTHDDIYFWVMAILKGTKIKPVRGFDYQMLNIDGNGATSLCKINNKSGRGLCPDEAFARMCKEYPMIIDLVKQKDD